VQKYTDEVGAKNGADVGSMLWGWRYEVGFWGEEHHLNEGAE